MVKLRSLLCLPQQRFLFLGFGPELLSDPLPTEWHFCANCSCPLRSLGDVTGHSSQLFCSLYTFCVSSQLLYSNGTSVPGGFPCLFASCFSSPCLCSVKVQQTKTWRHTYLCLDPADGSEVEMIRTGDEFLLCSQ